MLTNVTGRSQLVTGRSRLVTGRSRVETSKPINGYAGCHGVTAPDTHVPPPLPPKHNEGGLVAP